MIVTRLILFLFILFSFFRVSIIIYRKQRTHNTLIITEHTNNFYYDMRNTQNIGRLFYYFCNTTSDLLSVETITKELSTISRDTVEKYIDYLESAYLINRNSPIFLEGKKVLKARPKIYVSDTSVLNAMISGRPEHTSPETFGKIAESAVFNSLSSYFKNLNVRIGFLRGGKRNEEEIDLVIKRPFKTGLCFEVKYRNKPEIKISDLVNQLSTT